MLTLTEGTIDVVPIPVTVGAVNTCSGSMVVFRSWNTVDFSVFLLVIGLLILGSGVQWIHIGYVATITHSVKWLLHKISPRVGAPTKI